ncbi:MULTISPECIES: glutamine--fructose-6-phosphate transaminase (isomerizing) [Tsukamurella]|uniref:Glutamine--fructose-6-phosphate aminotransferase [isomerizing] n=1 Tax=Tsukamurella strandjordii TaxID=147577 RepID=A0AA90NJ86_9ACTN|nr:MULTISPECIES: glutamine--fructose-6-phosphate transaminase (isomerizing) [Tsukamurella]MDP0399735.1 glutamine--fructose-6-phosphate transaminase (isomerizing) [Tsukamurella strandjordii]GIZ97340.1 glutamine--fructose-6-phosphate aminotransferase [isomerizing] [Tsukamurella sp. TY48]
MCGIVGYIGGQTAVDILIDGLTQLEYRGYDSAGIAVLGPSGAKRVRSVGRVRDLEAALPKRLAGKTGIGHTRWATHGAPSEANAHPHASAPDAEGLERIFVVHNGIIDNARDLRIELEAEGVELTSDTDTEAVAHLIARSGAETLEDAVRQTLARLSGTYALAVLDTEHPDRIVVARNGSPLIIGVGDKEMFVASDISAVVRHTSQVVHLDDGECATVTASGFRMFSADDNRAVAKSATTVDISPDELELGNHSHFMLKEIAEQPQSLERMLSGRLDERFATARLDGLNLDAQAMRRFKRVKILGCGSAYYMGQLGASVIEELARIPADAEPASEFRYRNPIIEPDTLYVAVSQSGETADTAFAVQEVKRKGGTIVGLVNVVGSTIAREVSGGIYLHAGPEVSVASTKANTHMAVGFALLALALGRVRDLSITDGTRIVKALKQLPAQIGEIIAAPDEIEKAAKLLAEAPSLFFIGRVRGYPTAREGAQKFKEISYRHAEAYQASELKHGPLALISPELPTVAIVPDDELLDRNVGALHEIAARGGDIVAITNPGVELPESKVTLTVPKSEPELDPILLMIPTQLLAYYAALSLGLNIDRPRNLAKSVTVE